MELSDPRLLHANSKINEIRALVRAEDQFEELAILLLWSNPAFQAALQSTDGPSSLMTEPQRVFAALSSFNMQILNGGLFQFFWNSPRWAAHLEDAIRKIGLPELADAYGKAVDQLINKGDSFIAHRKLDSLEAYVDAAENQDFEWFENLCYGEYDRTTNRWTGLFDAFYSKGAAYVFANLEGFVRCS